MVKDPVCKMSVDEKMTKFRSDYQGVAYYFCSSECKKRFDTDPSRYAKQ